MSTLLDHAKYELTQQGMFDEDSDYGGDLGRAVYSLIERFDSQRHSGGSAEMVIELFSRLARFQPLSPPTDDPDEWFEHEPTMWQNKRDSRCFSNDKGVHYFNVHDPRKHKLLTSLLPSKTRIWIWENRRQWVQKQYTSKISGNRTKEAANA